MQIQDMIHIRNLSALDTYPVIKREKRRFFSLAHRLSIGRRNYRDFMRVYKRLDKAYRCAFLAYYNQANLLRFDEVLRKNK